MTEAFIVAAMSLTAYLITFDPLNTGAAIKLLVLSAMAGSLLLHIVGRALTAPDRLSAAVAEVIRSWWPIMALSVFIIGGSLYARLADGIQETFLGFGLGMVFLPLVAIAVRASARPFWLLKALAVIYGATALVVMVMLGLGRAVYHEEIFIAVPLAAYFLAARPLRAWQAVLGFALLGACLLSFKNTTFLLTLTVLAACALVWIARGSASGRDPLRLAVGRYFGAVAVLLLAGAIAGLYMAFKSDLPDGSPAYRIEMYGIAWRRFLDSPLWGSGFTDSAVTYFELYRIAAAVQTLPTHSDVLDLLAHGGIIAIVLWALTFWRLLRIGFSALHRVARGDGADASAWRWLFVVSLVQVCAVVTYAVNPLIHRPVHGIWIWGSAGVMWALHRMLTDRGAPAPSGVPAMAHAAFA